MNAQTQTHRDFGLIVQNVIALAVRQTATWILTAILILFVPRYLGDSGLGKVTFAVSFTAMFQGFVNLGTTTFIIKHVAVNRDSVNRVFWNAMAQRVPLSLLAIIAIAVAVHLFRYPAESRNLVYVASALMAMTTLNGILSAIMQGLEEMRWPGFAEVVGKAVVTIAGIYVLVHGMGVMAYAWVLVAGMSVTFGVNLIYLARHHLGRPTIAADMWKLLFLGGLPFLVTAVLLQVYNQVDVTILRLLTRDAEVGWYGAALQLYATLNFFPLIVVTALLPTLTRMFQDSPNAMKEAARRSIGIVILGTVPIAVGTTVIADDIIKLLHYPDVFRHSVPLLSILSLTLPVTGILMVVSTCVIAANNQGKWALVTAMSVLVNASLNFGAIWLADRQFGNGAIGASAVSLMSEVFTIAIGVRLMPAGVFDGALATTAGKAVLGALTMAAAVLAVKAWAEPGALPLAVLGALVYGVAIVALGGISRNDLAVASQALRNRYATAETRGIGG